MFRQQTGKASLPQRPYYRLTGDIEEKSIFHYIGPSYTAHVDVSQKNELIFSIGFGYSYYKNHITGLDSIEYKPNSVISSKREISEVKVKSDNGGFIGGVKLEHWFNNNAIFNIGLRFTITRYRLGDLYYGK